MNLKEIHYGIEIETVKRTREQIAWAIHSVVGGTVRHVGIPSSYDPWEVEDLRGRVWKVVGDASLTSVPAHLRAEVVSPVLGYDDIPQLQEVVRAIRRAGGKINSQCGIHIHIDAAPFDGRHLGNLAKIIYKQEPLILHALGISRDRLNRYTRPVSDELIQRIEQHRPRTKDQLNRIWYGYHNRQPQHYDNSRYHGVNLHNVWYRGTVEFRWFEATLHAGRIKAYLQFCLAVAAKALNGRAASSRKRDFDPQSAKYDFRVFLLHLGLIGDEFKTARKHLMANMPGDAAFKNGRPKPQDVLPDERGRASSRPHCLRRCPMKILIRSTTLDGEPIPGSGETLQAADCLEVVELMRGQTPFTASRAPRDYMTEVLSGIEGGPTQPLPEDAAAAAAEFLTRLARHGLIEFLPDDKACDPWPERFLEALETVRLSGRTNMLDHPEVTRLTAEMGYPEVAEWLADHRREYAAFVLEGTRPLGKNFGGKEDPAPCADK